MQTQKDGVDTRLWWSIDLMQDFILQAFLGVRMGVGLSQKPSISFFLDWESVVIGTEQK